MILRNDACFFLLVLIFLVLALDSVFGDGLGLLGQAFMLLVFIAPLAVCNRGFLLCLVEGGVERWVVIFAFLYLVSSVISGSGYKYSLYAIMMAGVFHMSSTMCLNSAYVKKIMAIAFFVLLFVFFSYFFGFYDVPKNTIGGACAICMILFFLLFYVLNYSKSLLVLFILFFIAFFIALDYRGGIIQLFIVFLGLMASSLNLKYIFRVWFIYFCVLILSVFIVCFVLFFDEFSVFLNVEILLNSLTERGVKSGRELLWPILFQVIEDNVLFGVGAGFLVSDIYFDQNWSAHNLNLQVAAQVGLFGLVVLWVIYYKILAFISTVFVDKKKLCFVAFLWAGIVVFNSLEVSLFQNAMPLAAAQWVLMGFLCNKSLACLINETKNENNNAFVKC